MSLRSAWFATAFVVGLSMVAPPVAASEGTVNGWLEIKGDRIPLTNVFAVMEPRRLDSAEKEDVVILLTDEPVPEDLRHAGGGFRHWAGEQAHAGQLNGIIVVIDPETNVWSSGQRFSKGFGTISYSHSSSSSEGRLLHFDRAESGPNEIAGKLWMREPMSGAGKSDGPWQLQAELRTAVARQEPVTAKLTGAEAFKSPQYKTVSAFLQACKRKDLAQIRKTMDPASQATLDQMVAEQGRAGALEMLAGMAAESLKMKQVEVLVRGSKAEVKLMKVAPRPR